MVCCALLGVLGFRQNRFASRGLGLAFLAAIPLAAGLFGVSNIARSWDNYESKEDLQTRIVSFDREMRNQDIVQARFADLRSKARVGLRAAKGPYVVPVLLSYGAFHMQGFATSAEATQVLDREEDFNASGMKESVASYAMWKKDAIDDLNRSWLGNWIRFLPYAAYLSFPIFLFLFLSNALGVVFFRLRVRVQQRRLA
jgi:hypothetical protein